MRRLNPVLKILIVADAFNIFANAMLGPIYAVFVEKVGGGVLSASGAAAIFAFTAGVLIYFLSRFEDSPRHWKRLMIVSYLLFAFGYLGYLWVDRVVRLLAVELVLGIAYALGTPAYDAFYSSFLERGKKASQWGAFEAMERILSGGGMVAGGVLAAFWGFRVLFVTMAIAALAAALLVGLGLRGTQKASKGQR